MTCEEVEQRRIVDAYVSGKLPEAERDVFEEHYFGCDSCFEQVEIARAAHGFLTAKPAAKSTSRIWIPLVAAAAVLIAVAGYWKMHVPKTEVAVVSAPAEDPRVAYRLLSRFEPPIYSPVLTRGTDDTPRSFRDAMRNYSASDFEAAAQGLRGTVAAQPKMAEARFYLAISNWQIGNQGEARAELQRVVDGGDTPYRSEARFYLAKALLSADNVPGAREQLEILVREKGDWAVRAADLLHDLN